MAILQKNRKAAAGVGIAAAAAAVLALGAGTYAAFTDTETAPDATFAAGTLNLEVGQTVTGNPLNFLNLVPGQTTETVLTFVNTGTVNGNLSLDFEVVGGDPTCVAEEDVVPNGCALGGNLPDNLQVNIDGVARGTLTDLARDGLPAGLLPAQSQDTYTLTVTLNGNAGNEVQSDTATLTTVATLDQVQP